MSDNVLISIIGASASVLGAWISSRPKGGAVTPARQGDRIRAWEPTAKLSRFLAVVGIGLSMTALALLIFDFALQNRTWLELSVERSSSQTVARLAGGSFVRFDGYTSENNFTQPFTIYVSRAYDEGTSNFPDNRTPVVSVVAMSVGHPVSADISWSARENGDLVITKGANGPGVVLVIKKPVVFKGSVVRP